MDQVLKVTAGALIPSLATIVFNLMNFFFENYSKTPFPKPGESIFDIAAGCSFAIIGICVTAQDKQTVINLSLIFALLLLVLVLCEFLLPVFVGINKMHAIIFVDAVSLFSLSWAIIKAG